MLSHCALSFNRTLEELGRITKDEKFAFLPINLVWIFKQTLREELKIDGFMWILCYE